MSRRLDVDAICAPDGESHGATRCLRCMATATMHVSGLCSRCGTWTSRIPAVDVTAGMAIYDWGTDWCTPLPPGWVTVTHVTLDHDRAPGRVSLDVGYRLLHLDPDAAVWVATSTITARRQVAA